MERQRIRDLRIDGGEETRPKGTSVYAVAYVLKSQCLIDGGD